MSKRMLKGVLKDFEFIELYVDLEAKAERVDARTHTCLISFLEDLEKDVRKAIK